jgi:hypothetical protein
MPALCDDVISGLPAPPQFRLTGRLYLASPSPNHDPPLGASATSLAHREQGQPWYNSLGGELGAKNEEKGGNLPAKADTSGDQCLTEEPTPSGVESSGFGVDLDSRVYPPNQFHGRAFDWEAERLASWKSMSPQV